VSGGVFFAFSTFAMKALGRLPAAEAISAMNAINQAAPTPLFMLAPFGTGAVIAAVSVVAQHHLEQRWTALVLIGAALYMVCVVSTVIYYVPHNDALAPVDLGSPSGARLGAPPVAVDGIEPPAIATALAGATAFILGLQAGDPPESFRPHRRPGQLHDVGTGDSPSVASSCVAR
jgi:uncharacterized membrane protein